MANATGTAAELPRGSWGWMLALGILMTLLGVIGLGMTTALTRIAVFWFGILAIVGGVGQLVDAFHHKGWGAIVWHVLIAVLYVAVGIVFITTPLAAALWLTILTAIALVAVGVLRVVMAFSMRGSTLAFVGLLLSGIVSVVLGVMIYGTVTPPTPEALATPEGQLAWIDSWGWVIGLFVAIELLTDGLSLIAVAFAARARGAAGAASATA